MEHSSTAVCQAVQLTRYLCLQEIQARTDNSLLTAPFILTKRFLDFLNKQ